MPRNLHKTIAHYQAKYERHVVEHREATTARARAQARHSAAVASAELAVAQYRQNLYDAVMLANMMSTTKAARYPHRVEVNDMHDVSKGDFTPYTWAMENLTKPWRVYHMHGCMYFASTCEREATMFKMFWG